MTAMPTFTNYEVNGQQISDIFRAAINSSSETPYIVEWNNDGTLVLRQQAKLETLTGIEALQGAIRISNRTQGPVVLAVWLNEGEDRKFLTSSAYDMPRGEVVEWTALFMRATAGPGWYAVPRKFASEVTNGQQYPADMASYSADAVEGRNFGGRQVRPEECILEWSK